MTISGDCPAGRSQVFTFPRRKLLQRLAWVSLLALFSHSQSKYPQAPFAIGDRVADYWTDEFNNDFIEYGTVCGVCWEPKQKEWAYLIEWTSGEMPDSCYPCFDRNLTIGGDLRLANHV